MKRIFTLLAFLLMATATFAGWDDARLSITSMSVKPVRILVDGRQVQVGNRDYQITDLNPGFHRIQIYAVNNNNRRRGGVFGNNRDELIYNSTVNIRRGMHTDIIVNRFGKVFIDEQPIDNRYDDDNWYDRDNRGNNGGWGNDRNNDGWGNDRNNRNQPMDYQKFQQLKQSVERSNFDDNKMDLLRSVIPNNAFTAQQIKELVQLMSFEQKKLELAKYAYRYTTDRGNYFVVNDAFNYGTSKTELTRYIASYRD